VGSDSEKGDSEFAAFGKGGIEPPPREAPSWVFLLTGLLMGAAAGWFYCKGIAVKWLARGR
jgi:hypothetical protein